MMSCPNRWPDLLHKGKSLWGAMKRRCEKPHHAAYKYYGGKGIQVKIDKSVFMAWFINNALYEKDLQNCSVGRINHNLDYTIDNIVLESVLENRRDGLSRALKKLKSPLQSSHRKIKVTAERDGVGVSFYSFVECSSFLGIESSNINAALKKRRKTVKGYTFIYGDSPRD